MKIGLFNAVWMLLAASLGGCTTTPFCDSLGKCGGDFNAAAVDLGGGVTGTEWVAAGTVTNAACIDQVPSPPDPPSLALIPPRPAGVRPIEQSTTEWCAGLVLKSDGTIGQFDDGWYEALKRYNGWFPSVPLYTSQLEIHTDNQYAMTTTQLVSQHVELSATCLVAQGVVLKCDDAAAGLAPTGKDLTTQLQTFVQDKLKGIKVLTAVVYGNQCVPGSDGSCTCDYNVSLTTTTAGPWQADNAGHISFYDAAAAPPGQADFCANPGTLQLSGSKETDLFNRTSLKTLALHPPTCDDKVQSKTLGETGIDCGGKCPACP
jgi:hypothetical protein